MVRLLGFEVRIRAGFLVFLAVVVGLYADAFGWWLAASLTVFTLVHELAHAVAARRFGAHAHITLELFAGTTSYRAERPLTNRQQAVVAAAGPVVHLALAVAVLAALGVDPTEPASIGSSPAVAAIWWAGLAIGAFNLIPVVPLDGGHLLRSALEPVFGDRAPRVVVWWSLTVTSAVTIWLLAAEDRRWYAIFAALLLVAQWRQRSDQRAPTAVTPLSPPLSPPQPPPVPRSRPRA